MARRSSRGDVVRSRVRVQQTGFTYLGLLAAIVILGIALTAVSRVWSFTAQRDKEEELLFVGDQIRMAISRYFVSGHQYPHSLQDLVEDNRFPIPRRYLRRVYRDPLTGDTDWVLIPDPTNTGIMGVASRSKLVPIKRAGFPLEDIGFADSECYCNWRFIYNLPSQTHRYTVPGRGP